MRTESPSDNGRADGRPSSRTVTGGGLASGLAAAEVSAMPSTSTARLAILAVRTTTALPDRAATSY